MKKCRYCKTEIDEKAKICPSCRKKQSNPILRGIMIFFGIMIIFAGISSLLGEDEKTTDLSKYITLEEFNQIENGMSYEQVKNIIGSEGTINSQTKVGDIEMIIYSWYASNEIANANFTFQNDKLLNKTQIGLE